MKCSQKFRFTIMLIRHYYPTQEIQDWLVMHGSREQIIDWLVWNDGNGVYTDEDSEAEGYEPLTLDHARSAMRKVLERDR